MRITLQAAISHCSEAAVHSHPFLKNSPENSGVRVLLLVKLQTDSTKNVFLEIFQKLSERLNIIDCKYLR